MISWKFCMMFWAHLFFLVFKKQVPTNGTILYTSRSHRSYHRHIGKNAHAPTPYCWYGTNPSLFDAPSRDFRIELDWIAHSYLAASPIRGNNRRKVTPLAGFSWGFHIFNKNKIDLLPVTALTGADWEAHLPYLRKNFKKWKFNEMLTPKRLENPSGWIVMRITGMTGRSGLFSKIK